MDDTNLVQGNYYSYDSTLKKLLHIIKSKTSDNIKQLEDLWESINTNNIQQINIVPINNNNKISSRISPARSSSSQSPVHLSESSNDSTNSNSSNLKREASKMCSSPVYLAIKKPKIDNYSPNFNSSSNNKSKTSPDSKTESVIVNIDSMDSIAVQNEKTEITNMTVDMLDFSCSICKQFNQEPNNKLIECRQCTHLYHQLCHTPKIENSQLEQQHTTNSSNDEQMVWYVSKCNKCIIENEQVDSEVDKINSEELKEDTTSNDASNGLKTTIKNGINKTPQTSIDTWQFKKDKTSPTNQKEIASLKPSNSLSSFSNLSTTNNAVNNITLNSSTNSINSNGKNSNSNSLINNTNGIKGLAGLATKLNPNSNQQQHQNNSSASSIATSNLKKSSNPDFLFKKFKESATGGGGGTVQQTNENKTADLIGKKGPVSLQVSSSSESNKKSTTHLNGLINSNSKTLIKPSLTSPNNNNNNGNSSTTNNIHKKNPFNISNSLTTKTSNSCATQNNLKEKKINSNLKPNSIQSSSSITTNTSNSNTNRSSKIS